VLINSKFRPPWWLRNPHVQTLWAAKVMRSPAPITYRERLITPDEDFVDLDWSDDNNRKDAEPTAASDKPIVVIFHGLTGSSSSLYVKTLINGLNHIGYRSVAMNFRGCSGEPNRKKESYHSGHTKDISFVIDTISQRFPYASIAATGYSLGGNALLKYLAISPDNPLQHAIAVSPPLQLAEGARRMQSGLSRIYQNRLVGQLKDALDAKHRLYPELGIDELAYKHTKTFREFDAAATVPLHGFESVDEYYEKASTLKDLPRITTKTHILFAQDDPFFTHACIPEPEGMSDQVTFELATHGGHVSFVSGSVFLLSKSWLVSQLSALHDRYFRE